MMLINVHIGLTIFVITLIIALLVLLCVVWISDIRFYIDQRRIKKTERTSVTAIDDIEHFISILNASSLLMMKSGKKIEYPSYLDVSIVGRFFKNLKYKDPVKLFRFQYSECGWVIYGLLENAIKDERYLATYIQIRDYFDNNIYSAPFEIVDQSQCGMIALCLYSHTKDVKYRLYADKLFNWLLTFDTNYGLKYRENHQIIIVDTIGMSIPFLMSYYEIFHIEKAKELALKTVQWYMLKGCDTQTGIPAYGFELASPNIKIGRANWGRGISWFAIGLSYIDNEDLCNEAKNVLDRFNISIREIWERDLQFGQFVGQSYSRDLSAELPILYYMIRKNLIEKFQLDILAYSQMMHNGIMYNSSSSYTGIIHYGFPYGPNMLSQAYMIRLLNLCKD